MMIIVIFLIVLCDHLAFCCRKFCVAFYRLCAYFYLFTFSVFRTSLKITLVRESPG